MCLKVIDWVNRKLLPAHGCPHSPFGILSSVVKKRRPPRRGLQLERGRGQGFRLCLSLPPAGVPAVRGG